MKNKDKYQNKESQEIEISEQIEEQNQYPDKENDPNYNGEAIDQNLIYGPIKQRSCTDKCCCLFLIIHMQNCSLKQKNNKIFMQILHVTAMVLLSIASFVTGDPNRLAWPVDFDKSQCGKGGTGLEDYKYAYLSRLNASYLDHVICVKYCPSTENNFNLEYYTNTVVGKAVVDIYNTTRFGRACVPFTDDESQQQRYQQFQRSMEVENGLEESLGDLRTAWPVLLGSIFLTIFFGYLYLFLMSRYAACLTYSTIFLFVLLLTIAGGLMYAKATNLGPYQDNEDSSKKNEQIALAVMFWVLAFFVLLYICCNMKKIRLAIAIIRYNYTISIFIRCSMEFTRDLKNIFWVPLGIVIFYMLFLVFWLLAAFYIFSSGEELDKPISAFRWVEYSSTTRGLFFFHFMWFLLVSELVSAYSQFVVGSTASMWYFYRQSQQIKLETAVKDSLIRGIYHMGSLTYGAHIMFALSIIKTIFSIPQKCMESKRRQQAIIRKSKINQQEDGTQCCTKLCINCAECNEAFFRYINEGAYIQIGLSGRDFCKATHDGFYLMRRNLPSFSIVGGVGSMMIFLGKLFICVSTSFICYIGLSESPQIEPYLYSPVLPVVYIAIATYFMGTQFVTVYGTSADAILQCYCIDEQLHNERGKKASFVPSTLNAFLENNPGTPVPGKI